MFRLNADNRWLYNSILSLNAKGNSEKLRVKRVVGVFIDLYEMGRDGIEPSWLGKDDLGAAAWLAGRDDSNEKES